MRNEGVEVHRVNVDTSVVSITSCYPWNRGNPSAKTSTRRSSRKFGATMSMGENHFHQKPLSSETTFIKKPLKGDRTKHAWVPKTIQSVFFGESVAGRRPGTFPQKHGLCPFRGQGRK